MYSNAGEVLVIDDDDHMLAIVRKLLEAEKFEVEVCSSAPGALELLATRSFDAILCDMWMPGMNGREFYLKLKEEFPDYLCKIIFVTGDIASEVTWDFIDERQLPYLFKPISRPLLRQRVIDIVGERLITPEPEPPKLEWDGGNRRGRRRMKIALRARLRRKNEEVGAPDVALVFNATRGGLYLILDQEYRVGMELLVAYPFTGHNDFEADGFVVRVEQQNDGRWGVALALGEEAASAREAFARASEDARKQHMGGSADATNEPPSPGKFSGVRQTVDDEKTRRIQQQIAELRRSQESILENRDRLETEAAALKKKLEEAEATYLKTREKLQDTNSKLQNKIDEVEDKEFRATHDALTGLWNRAAILDLLRREMFRSDREGTLVGVLLADLDHFKNVNDTYGHLAGDEVLREAARRIGATVRSYDAVGRYGGEEFIVVLAGYENSNDMLKQAERIRTTVADGPVAVQIADIHVTVSMGLASSEDIEEVEQLLRAADAALYRAKRGGRNRVEFASTAELTGS